MKVYLLWYYDATYYYEGVTKDLLGVFSTEDKADEAKSKFLEATDILPGAELLIEEALVDVTNDMYDYYKGDN